jgi:hypothetical protein
MFARREAPLVSSLIPESREELHFQLGHARRFRNLTLRGSRGPHVVKRFEGWGRLRVVMELSL